VSEHWRGCGIRATPEPTPPPLLRNGHAFAGGPPSPARTDATGVPERACGWAVSALRAYLRSQTLPRGDQDMKGTHENMADGTSAWDFSAESIDGRTISLATFRGQVGLIVNTASECGFTPQYAGLQALFDQFKNRGFVVLGFPCNQFGRQEPGSNAEIATFCEARFGVTFPLFARIDVNGADVHPLFAFLKSSRPGLLGIEAIKWNFSKFLVDRHGTVVGRYAPNTPPAALAADIERLLG
jgi:glutathione peroxidase